MDATKLDVEKMVAFTTKENLTRVLLLRQLLLLELPKNPLKLSSQPYAIFWEKLTIILTENDRP